MQPVYVLSRERTLPTSSRPNSVASILKYLTGRVPRDSSACPRFRVEVRRSAVVVVSICIFRIARTVDCTPEDMLWHARWSQAIRRVVRWAESGARHRGQSFLGPVLAHAALYVHLLLEPSYPRRETRPSQSAPARRRTEIRQLPAPFLARSAHRHLRSRPHTLPHRMGIVCGRRLHCRHVSSQPRQRRSNMYEPASKEHPARHLRLAHLAARPGFSEARAQQRSVTELTTGHIHTNLICRR